MNKSSVLSMVSFSLSQVLSEPSDPEGRELFDAFKYQQKEFVKPKKPVVIKKPKKKKLHLTAEQLTKMKRKRRDFK